MSSFVRSVSGVVVIQLAAFPCAAFAAAEAQVPGLHPAAAGHLPFFITAPGATDVLFVGVAIFLLVMILIIGNLYFQLHALPERMAHRTNRVQMEIVAVLALLALFTHNNLYWVAGLLLALVRFPDFSTPVASIAASLEKLAQRAGERRAGPAVSPIPVSDTEIAGEKGPDRA